MPAIADSPWAGRALDGPGLALGLFGASCLLSIVSWYTTWQGMALYLSGWFAFLASLGVQIALVLVAWLVGLTRKGRAVLLAVYGVTALVSIAFSYVSLHTWFAARERPAQVERKLYDELTASAGTLGQLLAAAASEGQKHVLALEEMTRAEKARGFISRGLDADPYLARVREAVAREGRSLEGAYREGTGAGVRYTAFDRHSALARQSLDQIQASQRALAAFKGRLSPLDPAEVQIRSYREVYDAVPWQDVQEALHPPVFQKPAMPAYGDHVDHTASGQEDLLLAFQELVTAPSSRHILALLLAAFIDGIVFLLAYGAGPHLAGSASARSLKAAAVLDGVDPQVFTRGFLRKLEADGSGFAKGTVAALTPGERQFCLLLCAQGEANLCQGTGPQTFLLDEGIHQELLESLARPGLPLRAALRAEAQA